MTLFIIISIQIKLLGNVNSHKDGDAGGGGESGMPVDYFDLIYERLLKEIETLMNSAKQVMALPNSHKHSNQDFEQAWKNET